jgi:hypothetical protein
MLLSLQVREVFTLGLLRTVVQNICDLSSTIDNCSVCIIPYLDFSWRRLSSGCCAVLSGTSLPTFQRRLLLPSYLVKIRFYEAHCAVSPSYCHFILLSTQHHQSMGGVLYILVLWLWGWDWRLTRLRPLLRAFCPSPDEDEWRGEWMNEWIKELFFNFRKSGAHGRMILTGENRRTRRKTCPSTTFSTINSTGFTWSRTQAAAVRAGV